MKVKKNYNNKIEQEKIDQLKSMKLHGQFERDTDNKKSEVVRKKRLVASSIKIFISFNLFISIYFFKGLTLRKRSN